MSGPWGRKTLKEKGLNDQGMPGDVAEPVVLKPKHCRCNRYPVIIVRRTDSNTGNPSSEFTLGKTWTLDSGSGVTIFVQLGLSSIIYIMGFVN